MRVDWGWLGDRNRRDGVGSRMERENTGEKCLELGGFGGQGRNLVQWKCSGIYEGEPCEDQSLAQLSSKRLHPATDRGRCRDPQPNTRQSLRNTMRKREEAL